MQIYGPFRLSAAAPTTPSAGASRLAGSKPADSGPRSIGPTDQLDLSALASTAATSGPSATSSAGGDIRVDRVADLRRQIAAGGYDTPEKMDLALDRMLDAFA